MINYSNFKHISTNNIITAVNDIEQRTPKTNSDIIEYNFFLIAGVLLFFCLAIIFLVVTIKSQSDKIKFSIIQLITLLLTSVIIILTVSIGYETNLTANIITAIGTLSGYILGRSSHD